MFYDKDLAFEGQSYAVPIVDVIVGAGKVDSEDVDFGRRPLKVNGSIRSTLVSSQPETVGFFPVDFRSRGCLIVVESLHEWIGQDLVIALTVVLVTVRSVIRILEEQGII